MKIVILSAVEEFISSLTPKETAKLIHTVELLELFGNTLGMPHSKHLSDGLIELRISSARQIRIFYCFHKSEAVLLHAYIKKTQKTPARHTNYARKLMAGL